MSKGEVTIRSAKKEDMVVVASLFQELIGYHKLTGKPFISSNVLQRDGFDISPPAFKCLVAEYPQDGNRIVGYALYFPTYSTWEGRSMMLQDLYVKDSERRKGIGGRLFNAVAMEATTTGCSRLNFHVIKWNEAKKFYEDKGAIDLTSTAQCCCYRLSGDALRKAAKPTNKTFQHST